MLIFHSQNYQFLAELKLFNSIAKHKNNQLFIALKKDSRKHKTHFRLSFVFINLIYLLNTLNSTRLFFSRPSGVSFGATG